MSLITNDSTDKRTKSIYRSKLRLSSKFDGNRKTVFMKGFPRDSNTIDDDLWIEILFTTNARVFSVTTKDG